MFISVFGSCRQDSVFSGPWDVSGIREKVTYPHYTKEILELIRFCRTGHLMPHETTQVFRTPILTKQPIDWPSWVKSEYENTDLFIVEIASRMTYKLDDTYVHHIAADEKYGMPRHREVCVSRQAFEEVGQDIAAIRSALNRPLLVVTHIYTYETGDRFTLASYVQQCCRKLGIPCINPAAELSKRGFDVKDLVVAEKLLWHYNDRGHAAIRGVYYEYISEM